LFIVGVEVNRQAGKKGGTVHVMAHLFLVQNMSTVTEAMNVLPTEWMFLKDIMLPGHSKKTIAISTGC